MSKLNKKIQILYGLGVSYAIVDQIFAQWILYFYLPPESSDLKPIMPSIMISLALVISRFVDMLTDPIVGFLSDKLNTRWGRRVPFIAVGAIPLAISTVAFFYPPTGSTTSSFIYLALIGSLFFSFYTIVGAPYNAMIPEIAHTSEDRLNLSTWQSIFRLLYTAIAMILPPTLIELIGKGDTLKGIRGMIIVLSTITAIGSLITVFGVPEKKYSKPTKSDAKFFSTLKFIIKDKNFIFYLLGLLFFFIGFNNLRAILNYFVEDIMDMGKGKITLVSAVLFGMSALFFYPTNLLAKKYGYKKILLSCIGSLVILSLLLAQVGIILPKTSGILLFGLIGIPLAGAGFIFPPAMLSELSEKISVRNGNRIEGVCFGIQGFFLKMAFLISILLLPIILVLGNVSILDAITGIESGVSKAGIYKAIYVSIINFIISFIFYWKYQE